MSAHLVNITKVQSNQPHTTTDYLAVEEPLEIRIRYGKGINRQEKSIAITMRTPSDDFALAAGFLFGEGIVSHYEQIQNIRYCASIEKEEERGNVVRVELIPDLKVNLKKLERHFYTTSSCGVCGKSSIESLEMQGCPIFLSSQPLVTAALIHEMPETLRTQQAVFEETGGLHAAGLFDANGKQLILKEDVGRHNAVDKVVGAAIKRRMTNLSNYILVVSGRMSFELVQKAIRAGIPMMIAVGAPSSLAVQLAKQFGMTLIGFTRNQRFNVYCGEERVLFSAPKKEDLLNS